MPYKSKEKQKEYQREWIANRRLDYFRGKSCIKCGSTERLELDHIDPSTKISNSIWSWAEERRVAEIAKCQILCSDCHLQKTLEFDRAKPTHGTETMYCKYKCRCDFCKQARSLAKEANRARRKEQGLPRQ